MTADLPPPLQRAVHDAASALEAAPPGHLSLRHRRRIWEALGELGGTHRPTPGHRRRAMLDLLTVEHVKPVWDEAYPGDPAVDEVLDAARRALSEGPPHDEGLELASRADIEFVDRPDDDVGFGPGYVGQGACAALMTAIGDKSYNNVPLDADDEDLDVDDWDASFFGELAAGGEPDDPAVGPGPRREFWRWYLDEAVPAAWTSAPG